MLIHENERQGTASHFADWVFNNANPYYCPKRNESKIAERQKIGRIAHEQIERLLCWIGGVKAAKGLSSNWELIYSDPHDGSNDHVFHSSRLIVDKRPMRCRPDVVFRDVETGLVIVVERKVTGWPDNLIPVNTWANIRAQLWCYGWIDEWVDAPDVILACQFWRRRKVAKVTKNGFRQDKKNPWILNYFKHPGWRRSYHSFHNECIRYFHDYGGQFVKK